jgi:glycosyltransferase involved in cell wall biosynthesis
MKVSWCATCSKDDLDKLNDTLRSISSQTVPPHEIIVSTVGNIAQGRNEYLQKATGDYIATFDGGCVYDERWTEIMLNKLIETDSDIVIGEVLPMEPVNKIQEFCSLRVPNYKEFAEHDWDNYIPSNRQVIFKKDIIDKIGLVPEKLWRADDTYWFQKARNEGLKFTHCDAVVYWETKKSLKSYLWTVYNDNKADAQFNIKPFSSPKKRIQLTPYGIVVSVLALNVKMLGKFVGRITRTELC